MKTFKSLMLASALLAVFSAANAAQPQPTTDVPFTEDYVVTTYIAAMTAGDTKHISSVLANDAKFSILQNKQVVNYSKQDMMTFFNANKGVTQDCTTTTSNVETNADNAVVEVDMNYSDHVRANFVTMVNTDSGWKITDVYSIFK